MKPTIAISLGDPAGIGPEITVASLETAKRLCTPVLFGHLPTFAEACRLAGRAMDDICCSDTVQRDFNDTKIQFIAVDGPDAPVTTPGLACGQIQLASLAAAVTAILAGKCDGIVTAPVSKEQIDQIQPGFTGHTEYLASRCGLQKDDVTMVFATPTLVVGLISTHVPLAKIPETITEKRYRRTLQHVIETVRQNTLSTTPRIAVAALNPHAGEAGLLGREEIDFITPFCRQNDGIDGVQVSGAIPADAVYRDAFAGKYDGVVAAYHDQALIPLKLSGFGGATNVTVGLPFIRTSPDHGTAYDLARKNLADATAMKTAIEMAVRLVNGKHSQTKLK